MGTGRSIRNDRRVIRAEKGKRQEGALYRPSILPARQRYMLSYLNKAQKDQWNSYSPARRRRIMEEIEKKLERKMGQDIPEEEAKGEASSFFDPASYLEETKEKAGKIRGHPDRTILRKIKEADLRNKTMTFRAGNGAEGQLSGVKKGRPPGRDADLSRKGGKKRTLREVEEKKARKKEFWNEPDGRLSPGAKASMLEMAKGPSTRYGNREESAAPSGNGTDRAALPDVPSHAKAVHGRSAALSGSIAGIRAASYIQRSAAVRKERERMHLRIRRDAPEIRNASFSGMSIRWVRHGGERGQERPVFFKEEGPPAGYPRRRESVYKISGKAPTFTDGRIRGSQTVGNDERTAKEPLPRPERKMRLKEKKIRKEETAAMARSPDGPERPVPGETHFGEELPEAAFKERDRPVLTLRKEEKETAVFKLPYSSGSNVNRFRGGARMKKSRREKKREAKYKKAFLAELVSIIEKDMAKDRNIRQAQKSGQIRESVSFLTEQTGRRAFSYASVPLRLRLHFIARRLRTELAARLKAAAVSLIRSAAVFGAPVFAILIIVVLLAGICMVGTTGSSPRGTGLGFKIVQEAKKHLGLPYVYGGTSLVDGCDCSGFVWAIYNIFGYSLPRTAGDQYAYGRKVGSDINDWQMGDLIYYSRTGSVQSGGGRAEHIVIYIGGGQVISCGPVAIYNWDYRSDYYGTCRIIPDEPLGGDFSGSTNEEICWNYFVSQGFSEAATAGILGNMYVESGGTFDPSIHQYGGGPGRGLCQWEESYSGGSGRYNSLVSFAAGLGKEWDDITAQLQFVCYELDSGAMNPYFSKFGGVEAFKNMTDPVTATYVFLCGFEYCGDPGESFMEANFSLSTRVDHAGWAYLNYQ